MICAIFPEIPETDLIDRMRNMAGVWKLSVVKPILEYGVSRPDVQEIRSCEEACALAQERGISLTEVAVWHEMSRSGFTRECIRTQMEEHLQQIKQSPQEGEKENQLLYGLASGKDVRMLMETVRARKTVSGGIVPGSMVTIQETYSCPRN